MQRFPVECECKTQCLRFAFQSLDQPSAEDPPHLLCLVPPAHPPSSDIYGI